MKRFILPLLAALTLPTAVNAEYLNLECKINSIFDDSSVKEKYNFSINLNGNDTKITANEDLMYAESEVTEGEIFILYRENSPDSIQSSFIINRVNGNVVRTLKVNKLAVGDPFYNKALVTQIKNLKPTKELPQKDIDALLTPQISSGKCKKTKKVKTMF